jgi:hypothetical protein
MALVPLFIAGGIGVSENNKAREKAANYRPPPTLEEQIASAQQDVNNMDNVKNNDITTLDGYKDALKKLEELRAKYQFTMDAPIRLQASDGVIAELQKDKDYIQGLLDDTKKTLNINIALLESSQSILKQANDDYNTLNNAKELNYNEMRLSVETIKDLFSQINNLTININDLNFEINKIGTLVTEYDISINSLNKEFVKLTQEDWSNKVYNSQNILNLNTTIDVSLNHIFSYLKTKNINPNLLYEKINYRSREQSKLYNRNKLLDILFYCFYFSFILIIICTRNSKREDFLIYLFVGLIPFLYPFLFKFGIYLNNIRKNINIHQNAFIDTNTVYEYDI